MINFSNDPFSIATYLLLAVSIILAFIPKKKTSLGILAIAVIFGFAANRLAWPSLIFGLIFFLLNTFYRDSHRLVFKILGVLGISVLGVALMSHLVPGFNNWKVISSFLVKDNSSLYSSYLNFDKPLIALGILLFGRPAHKSYLNLSQQFKKLTQVYAISVPVLFSVAYAIGFIRFEFKLGLFTCYFFLQNLIFTCTAEEVFFRGFFQRELEIGLARFKFGPMIALIFASILFGAAHYKGGMSYIVVSSIAGLFYGFLYQKTKKVELSILLHALINLTHLIFFTYPRWQTVL